ncbi:MAG: PAS domain-containing protein, partial [Pseudomonadota bacterium]
MWSRTFKRSRRPRLRGIRPALLSCLLCLPPVHAADSDGTVLRVGIYHNPPKIQYDGQGDLTGILGDLLSAIADRESWSLQPISCQWSDCLAMLEREELDLLPDVAENDARADRFDFHQTPALRSWSQLYSDADNPVSSLLDLDDRTVAVLSDSVQQSYLTTLTESFGLSVNWLVVDNFDQAFEAVRTGEADDAAANHYYGNLQAAEMELAPSPVMFEPSRLYFASSGGRYPQVLARIDDHLDVWMAQPGSPYFQILDRWAPDSGQNTPPSMLWWSLGALGGALLLMTGFSQLLRRRVAEQTRSLRRSEERLNTILDSVDAFIYIKNTDLRYEYVNRKVSEWLQRPLNRILGYRDSDLFDERTASRLEQTDRQILEHGQRHADEEINSLADNAERRTFLTVKIPLRDADNRTYALCGISTDITEHRRIQDQLHRLAWFDPVTGLGNRRLLLDRLEH